MTREALKDVPGIRIQKYSGLTVESPVR